MIELAPKAFGLLISAESGAFVFGCNRPKNGPVVRRRTCKSIT